VSLRFDNVAPHHGIVLQAACNRTGSRLNDGTSAFDLRCTSKPATVWRGQADRRLIDNE